MKSQECRTINRQLKHLLDMHGWLGEVSKSPYLSEATQKMVKSMQSGAGLAYRELDSTAKEAGYKDPYLHRC